MHRLGLEALPIVAVLGIAILVIHILFVLIYFY